MVFSRLSSLLRTTVFVFLLLFVKNINANTAVVVSSDSLKSDALQEIVDGIKNELPVNEYNIYSSISDLPNDRLFTKTIILGKDAIESATSLSSVPANWIFGGIVTPNRNLPIDQQCSLSINVGFVLDELRKTGPLPEKIYTVSINNDGLWLANNYKILQANDIELVYSKAKNIRSVARAWFDVLVDINPDTDAIWMSESDFLDQSGALKNILEEAWRRNILVFSTVPSLSTRGVAIGFIPRLDAYGAMLARKNDSLESVSRSLDDNKLVSRIFNKRTLEHIGRDLPKDIDIDGYRDLIIK